MTEAAATLFHRKRRAVVRGSITKLDTKLTELESHPSSPNIVENTRNLADRLKSLKQEFKNHQLAIIDRTDTDDELAEEQQELDQQEDIFSALNIRIQHLLSHATSSRISDSVRVAGRQLALLQTDLQSICDTVTGLDDKEDGIECILEEYRDRAGEIKAELAKLRTSLLSSETEDAVMTDLTRVEKLSFDCLLIVKKRIRSIASTTATAASPAGTSGSSTTKLPKLELPSFHGDILQWKNFWEQFCVSVHDRASISQEEKLMYLQNAIKDRTAKSLIAGLTKTSDHYDEAVKCLQERYDRPRQIHQTHVRRIVEAPSLKDGTGKEIRALHDLVVQHLRALKTLGHDPSQAFITSQLEMKLDPTTMFEWQRHSQKHSQKHTDVPDYQELLDFLNLRAQASEAFTEKKRSSKPFTSLNVNVSPSDTTCVSCGKENHPLYLCNKFRSLPHSSKMELIRAKSYCLNCLRPGHFAKKCKSLSHCKRCQRPHHTLLHSDGREREAERKQDPPADNSAETTATSPTLHVSVQSNILLMTCQVMVSSPQGMVKARALLDTGSSASFISERLAQSLHLRRHRQDARICGIAGIRHSDGKQSVAQFVISSMYSPCRRHSINAFIVPQITDELPQCAIYPDPGWTHLNGLFLADPEYYQPGKVDILLGVSVFVDVIRHGRRSGPPNSPIALNTDFGWVLAGDTGPRCETEVVSTYLTSVITSDDLLRQFWEVEEKIVPNCNLTIEEKSAIEHFNLHHTRTSDGRFVVPLPKRLLETKLGESRSQAVHRFLSFERSTRSRGLFPQVKEVVHEYFDQGHAEEVPIADLEKPQDQVFYLPMHIVLKESSSTTKVRAVFDASAATSTGISLNSTLMVGPTVHPPLVDVLMRFRNHRVALVADISRMYRAVCLAESDKDLHRFVWRDSSDDVLKDFRMTRVTFGVSASSFIANMCVKQNAIDFGSLYPNAAKQVETSYYVDDYLGGADSQKQQPSFREKCSHYSPELCKWNCSDPTVLANVSSELKDSKPTLLLSEPDQYTKTLGIEWNVTNDHFRVKTTELPPVECMTKRSLISDVAKTFDALGWFSPVIVKAKILLQMLWIEKVGWDDLVPDYILEQWSKWRQELPILSTIYIPRCYHPKHVSIASVQLHGFSDASEKAYSGVVYLRMKDNSGAVHTSIVVSKTRVAPIKSLTIPRLELNGALTFAVSLQGGIESTSEFRVCVD